MKEEIDIQVESLKIELENLRDVLFSDLHNCKKDFIEYILIFNFIFLILSIRQLNNDLHIFLKSNRSNRNREI